MPEGVKVRGGIYILKIYIARPTRIEVGKLGVFRFPQGYYAYVGRALKGFRPRLGRHLRKGKKLKWHIDYLLSRGRVLAAVVVPTADGSEECVVSRWLAGLGRVLAPRFGSSDCHCPSHLLYFGSMPPGVFLAWGKEGRDEGSTDQRGSGHDSGRRARQPALSLNQGPG